MVVVIGLRSVGAAAETPADPVAVSAVIKLGSIRDNTLYEGDEALSNGKGEHFFAGVNGLEESRRGLLKFAIANNVPPNALIISATLALHVSKNPILPHQAESFQLHRVLSDWGEGTSDAPFGEGTGTTATVGDATWSFSYYSPTPTQRLSWTNPGGDFLPTASASTVIGDEREEPYTWQSTPGMLADLWHWLRFPDDNHGWIVLGNESDAYTARRFDSRENSEPSYRPVLTVEYVQAYPSYIPLVIGK
jgi:hypothetical protein